MLRSLALLVAMALLPCGAAAEGPAASPAARGTWKLGALQVLSPGAKERMKEGTLTKGYTVTATATALGGAPFEAATFTMSIDAFAPVKDLPRQPKGFWYVRGNWRLVQQGAAADADGRRTPPAALQGFLVGQLPLDPTQGKGGYALSARSHKGQAGGRWAQASGTVNVSEQLEGSLFLELE